MSGMLYSVKHYAERSDLVLLFRSLDEAREAMNLLVRHGFLDCDSFMEGFLRELGMPEFASGYNAARQESSQIDLEESIAEIEGGEDA